MWKRIGFVFYIVVLVGFSASLYGQNYQAMHGSSYAGSLGVANNPASIVHVPYAWDVTPVAVQAKHSTNAFAINNFSLLSPGGKADVQFSTGEKQRFLMANQDIRLLNTRIRLNENSAIAFGASIRSYVSAKTSRFNWQDTITGVKGFMDININNTPLFTELRANSWVELFGTYAKTLVDDGASILNAGVTLKVNRGLGGAYVNASNIDYFPTLINGEPTYFARSGELAYGYSSNFDELDSGNTFNSKRKQFFQKTYSTIAASLGVEYILRGDADSDDPYAYSLKIGASLLDLGYNTFQYSSNSQRAIFNKDNISDSLIQATFENLDATSDLPDSLASIAGTLTQLYGKFRMYQPARIVINADKHIAGNFYVNGELTLPLIAVAGNKTLFARDINLVALTPRYESRAFGFYLPVTFNIRQQLWVGGALRAGPLLLGMHSFANLFSKNKMQNGGAYMALTFRPGQKKERAERSGSSGAGRERQRGKQRKNNQMGCPVF